jgi:hypothetical protein
VVNFGDLEKKAQQFLDSEEGEKQSDVALEKVAEFLDDRTGGTHAAQIEKGREFADQHIGRDEHRR